MAEIDITVSADTTSLDATIARMTALEQIVAKYAALIVAEAKRLSPVRTGALRDSIQAHLNGLAAEITAGENLPDIRAIIMEYGSGRVAARPYLRPSVEAYREAFIAEVQAVLSG